MSVYNNPGNLLLRIIDKVKLWLLKVYYSPIKIKKYEDIFEATARNGQKWFIPINSKEFALWTFTFKDTHERYLDAIKEGDIIVEVGACTGEYTVPAAQKVGKYGKIFAFEVDPLGCKCTKKNAELYGLSNIIVINSAVSDRGGKKIIYKQRVNISGGIIEENKEGELTTVTLDEFFKNADIKVDVLKLTVNGHELEILKGAKKLLKDVRAVIFQSPKYREVTTFLKKQGFKEKKSKMLDNDVKIVWMER